MSIRLVQLRRGNSRLLAIVEEPRLRLLGGFTSVYALAWAALESDESLHSVIREHQSDELLDYDPIYAGASNWKLICPIDHQEPARLLVSGTGLTHLGSAKDRQSMHQMPDAQLTDSMKMFRLGLDGGKPAAGKIGNAPEWFYKGCGTILRSPNEPLEVPPFALDGGEEGEIAGVYIIAPDGKPCRIGMAVGNEFSDHKFEKINYLNLAGSKLRTCSIGPELVIDAPFKSVAGRVRIERAGQEIWSRDIRSGEEEMAHSLANIEHHHFKFDSHRRPGDVHVHYFGAHSLSFGDNLKLENGDLMSVRFEGYGRALTNPLAIRSAADVPVQVTDLNASSRRAAPSPEAANP